MGAIEALGIDFGSTTAKIVGVDRTGKMLWHLLEPAEPRVEQQVEHLLSEAQQVTGSLDGIPVVATGYGRRMVYLATRQVTEITCHARGAFQETGHGGTLVDIGGQDSKVINIGSDGKVLDFVMNDKCSAGTGRFLENTARRLSVPLEELGDQALSTLEETSISSTCTVFAESEVISLIAHGVSLPSILRGLHHSLVRRIVAMVRTVGLVPPMMLFGGVAQNPAIRQLLEEETGEKVCVSQYPQLLGARGAALIALENPSTK
jgi:(R)-2-hydroxyacyl-CoA dehydratese activating ATPase